ncbi:MAG: transketolase [Paenibacillus macerans]|uniref:transketolase n=1 Tax=Paenibacillus TaxID=44249 RepID=UPI00055CDFCF|nr:transketolase [Paenibacillus macerans]MBS5909828.1 transketolase [Paenibacillus macerans]MCY7556825.1 transketolase [Paenibacillus macerans]MDU5947772.1 transketolase [Paenibacillus macerans]MDU7476466.1 transketolase [Paenibacillus macerans]MEC0136487.1 transketolase [Paenibacillus macerans]
MGLDMQKLELFRDEIRLKTLKELHHLGFGHYGGSLSIVEVLAVLYGGVMKVDPQNPKWEERDYFILSKGHGGPGLYAALAAKGYFPEEVLYTLNQNGTKLPSHPDKNLTPGVDMTTGSLGQGISAAVGVALSHKLSGKDNYTYCIVGDGELNEGQCWEAFQFAAHHKLNRLFVFVDDNKKQLDGLTKDIIDPLDFAEKFSAFGFYAMKVDGGSLREIHEAIEQGKAQGDQPVAIILDTVKGQGVPYLEEKADNHHIRPSEADEAAILRAIAELEAKLGKAVEL